MIIRSIAGNVNLQQEANHSPLATHLGRNRPGLINLTVFQLS